ncbi:MAG: trigger factor [Clostridia bacterium]|nr:trigger factor [Clostridia bacterium]
MKVLKNEPREGSKVYAEIEIDNETFEKAVERSHRKNVKSMTIPGFRKGHAPRHFIEKMYGEGIFYDDAINFVLPDAYDEAVKEMQLEPVAQPEIDIVKIGNGEGFVFSAVITVKPEVKLGDYKNVKVEKNVKEVTDEDVDREVATARENCARVISVEEGTPENGDTVVLDYSGSVDGVAFEGGTSEGYSLELGSGSFIPGFEEQLVGKPLNEEVLVNVTFPEEYHAPELAGKEAVFKCVMHFIEKKELPELDDEFAKDVSEFDTLDEYKSDIAAKLKEKYEKEAQSEFENAVIEKAAEQIEADIPEAMIENRIDSYIDDMKYRIESQGLSFEQYLQFTGSDEAAMRESLRPQAEKGVRAALLIENVAKAENVEATEEDIDEEIGKLAEAYSMEADKVREIVSSNMEQVKSDIVSRKTVKLIVGFASEE